MIKADLFYRQFDRGLHPFLTELPVTRVPGKGSKFRLTTQVGDIDIHFSVNSKSSGIPSLPGEFWPILKGPQTIHHPNKQDDGTISWYQFITEAQSEEIYALNETVLHASPCPASQPDMCLETLNLAQLSPMRSVNTRPEARHPHKPLYYHSEADALRWGTLLGSQLATWIEAFDRHPETLVSHMWRTHWSHLNA